MSLRKAEKLSARMIEKVVVSAIRRRSPLSADRLIVMYSLLRSRRGPPGKHNPNAALVGPMLAAFAPWLPFEWAYTCEPAVAGITSTLSERGHRCCHDQVEGHRPRQSAGPRPRGPETVLPWRAWLHYRRGRPGARRRVHDIGRQLPHARYRPASRTRDGAAPAARTDRARPHRLPGRQLYGPARRLHPSRRQWRRDPARHQPY